MKQKFYLTIFCSLITYSAFTQLFKPDNVGFVKDPDFHKLLKERKYELVTTFDSIEGYPGIYAAYAFRNGSTFLIDTDGRETVFIPKEEESKWKEDKYEKKAPPKSPLPENLELIQKDNGNVYVRNKSEGKEYLLPFHDKLVPLKHADRFPMSTFSFKVGEKWGLLSNKGEITLEPTYLAIREEDSVPERFVVLADAKLGIIDRSGKIILEPCLKGVYSGIVGKYGLYNTTNFGLVDLYTGKSVYPYMISDTRFYGTIYRVNNGKSIGLFDLANLHEILPPVYEYFYDVTDSLFVANYLSEGKTVCGMYDLTGKERIAPEYDFLLPCPNTNFVLCKLRNNYGIVSNQNKILIPPNYSSLDVVYAPHFKYSGYFVFTKNDLTGVMDSNQQIIIQPERCNIKAAFTGLCIRKPSGSGVYSFTGEVRIKPIYSKINDSAKPGVFTAHKANDPAIYKVDFYGNEVKIDLNSIRYQE